MFGSGLGEVSKLLAKRSKDHNKEGRVRSGLSSSAIERIYEDLMKLKSNGTAILLVSVELDEIMSLSDRIIVMNQGTIVGETNSSDATELDIGKMMSGLEQV